MQNDRLQASEDVRLGRIKFPALHLGHWVGRCLRDDLLGDDCVRVLEHEPLLLHLLKGVLGVAVDG